MEIILNGKKRTFAPPLSVEELIDTLGLGEQMVLVEQNHKVIPRDDMAEAAVSEGDIIEIFRLAGGG